MKSTIKSIRTKLLFYALILLSIHCFFLQVRAGKANHELADLVIINAKIVTIDNENPRAQAVAIKGETILAVTSNTDIDQYIAKGKTTVIDARNRLVIPGFNDAHIHFIGGGYSLMNLDFRYITDPAIIQKMVKLKVSQSKAGELIRGGGWDHELFPSKKWPTREILDRVAPENPVILSRTDGHSIWVNSLVLQLSGITKETPDPPGGTIVRNEITGEPTGILKESAQNLIDHSRFKKLSGEEKRKREARALELALEAARRTGVTSIQHLNNHAELFQQFHDQGKLTARVTFNMWLTDNSETLEKYRIMRQKFSADGNWIRFGYLKAFIDGTLGSGTALMFEPFKDDPSTCGLPQMPYKELEKKVVLCDKKGFQIGIHAIGTKGNHWILNAFEKARDLNGIRDSRHRSEHAQILTDRDIPRFAELGVIASMQPTHCITDKRFAEKRIGLDRSKGAYAWKRLLDSGAHIAFGTDWYVEPIDPLEGLYAAVTRKDRAGESGNGWFADQKLSMEKAIELYTLGSAYAEFMENRKGSIKKGMLADMVIFNRDLMIIPPQEIMKAKVDYTIVGGRIVYKRNQAD
jgi:predicted amidohydrolase YtcJ